MQLKKRSKRATKVAARQPRNKASVLRGFRLPRILTDAILEAAAPSQRSMLVKASVAALISRKLKTELKPLPNLGKTDDRIIMVRIPIPSLQLWKKVAKNLCPGKPNVSHLVCHSVFQALNPQPETGRGL